MSFKGGRTTGASRWAVEAAGLLVLAGLIGLLWWFRVRNAQPAPSARRFEESGAIRVYFTTPGSSDPGAAAPLDALVRAVDGARRTIDMAAYELDLVPLADALLAAADRGVSVRLVAESDNLDGGSLRRLSGAGIPLVQDDRPSLMHDKFVVIDQAVVWTGSMNFTQHGVFDNNNNLVRLDSAQAAALFTREFEEMFVQDRFSALSLSDPERLPLNLGGVQVEVYFAPDDHPAGTVMAAVAAAHQKVEFLAFTLTSADIARALMEQAHNGVLVRGVLEADQANGLGSQYDALQQAGVDIRLDGNPGLLHDKIIIVDGAVVITGSYNFSLSAETTNDENLLLIRSADVAGWYEREFERLYADALP